MDTQTVVNKQDTRHGLSSYLRMKAPHPQVVSASLVIELMTLKTPLKEILEILGVGVAVGQWKKLRFCLLTGLGRMDFVNNETHYTP